MRTIASFFFRVLAVIVGLHVSLAVAANAYLNPFADTENGAEKVQKADPGQVLRLYNLFYGAGEIIESGPNVFPQFHSVIRIESLTGAKPYPEPHYTDIVDVLKVPNTAVYQGAFTGGFVFYVKVNPLDRQGHSAPLVLKATIDLYNSSGDGTTPAHVHETCTFTLPITEIGNMHVAVNVNIPDATRGELHPGNSALYQYTTDAAGAYMDSLVFKAQVPKGTTFQSMYPAGGVKVGNEITWKPAGTLSSFDAGFTTKVNARPMTANATTVFGAAAKVQTFVRTAQETKKTPITGYDNGKLSYYTPTVVNGPVTVDQTYTYVLTNWDWLGGDVNVDLDGRYIGTGSAEVPYGEFTVPVFKDADLEEVLTAQQTTHPVDTIVTGKLDATVEMLQGDVAMVKEDHTVARKLQPGGKVAEGEVVTTDTSFPDQLGHLRLEGPSSGVVLHYAARPGIGSDGRLVFARNGDVAVYGGVRPHKIKLSAAALTYSPQDFTAYTTQFKTGVQNLGGTIPTDTTLSGYVYREGDLVIGSNVIFAGGVWFVTGNVTITGSLTGSGSFICLGNLTVQNPGKLVLKNTSSITLGVGGTLNILP